MDEVKQTVDLEPSRSYGVVSEPRSFFASFAIQTYALTKKNMTLQFRNRSSTCVQVAIGVLFLVLLLIMDVAIKANSKNDDSFNKITTRRVQPVWENLTCTVGPGLEKCYTAIYAPFDDAYANVSEIDRVMDAFADLNGLPVTRGAPFGLLKLKNATEVDDWILANQNMTKVAFLFTNSHVWLSPLKIPFSYVIQANETVQCAALGVLGCEDAYKTTIIPFQTGMDAAFVAAFGSPGVQDTVRINASFADFPKPGFRASFDVVSQYGASFLYIALTFNYVIQLTLIVSEKEFHLVEAMSQMGMIKGAYWLSWLISNTIINTVMVFCLLLFGYVLQLEVFVETSVQLMISSLWITAMLFTGLAFVFSTLTRSTSTARLIGIGVFVISFVAAPIMVDVFFADPNPDYDSWRMGTSFFPFFGFFVLMEKMIAGSAGPTAKGIQWDDRLVSILPFDSSLQSQPFWSLETTILYMVGAFFLYAVVTWYLDAVIPTEYGRHQPFYFCLMPSYWLGGRSLAAPRTRLDSEKLPAQGVAGGDHAPGLATIPGKRLSEKELAELDEDVREEVLAVYKNDFHSREPAVVIENLEKTFRRFRAVDRVTYAIDKNQLFVILGHNGAGKSTTFNMLTGLTHVTDGDAKIFGLSIRDDMAELHSRMGVCPQHDVLWDQLTAREHLEMFGRIKGIPEDKLQDEVQERLVQVNLLGSANIPTRGFSGGMKRRLSISIALLGNPSIVFLDEPTTGMDPVSRREVWDMIAAAKKGRVIILTTHSMEEADCLGDRVAVMSHGKLQAIGTSLRLKNRFGKGYRLTMFVKDAESESRVVQWMSTNAPKGSSLASSVEGAMLYQLPKQDDPNILVSFFRRFEAEKSELGVGDFSISLTTLEEVFLTLSDRDKFISNEELITQRRRSSSMNSKREKQMAALSAAAAKDVEGKPSFMGKVLEAEDKRSVSMGAQLRALFFKSLMYQSKQKLSCFMIVTFPLMMMIALLALDRALLADLKVEALCGDGVDKLECVEKGYDLECIKDRISFVSSFTSKPKVDVGIIQNSFGRRVGINSNCGTNACYHGLEKAEYRKVPLHGGDNLEADIGTLNYSAAADSLFLWQTDLFFLLQNSSCQDTYSEAFDSGLVCKDAPDRVKCQAEVRDLELARDYIASNKSGLGSTASLSLGACAKDSSTGEIKTPPQASLDKLEELESVRDDCLAVQQASILHHFDDFDVSAAVAAVVKSASGLMGNYTTSIVTDPIAGSFEQDLFFQVFEYVQTYNMSAFPSLIGWYMMNGKDITRDIPTLAQMCAPGSPWLYQLLMVLDGNANLRSNICAWALNIDAVRGLGFSVLSSSQEVDDAIYNAWFGTEVQTKLMKDKSEILPDKKKYLERSYYSQFHAIDFAKSDFATGEYAYTAYFNNSATSNSKHGNWRAITMLIDNAIVKRHTGHGVQIQSKPWPKEFKCNRDAWLKGEAKLLDCPSILPSFLSLSILDFVASALFPYIFLLHSFIIVSLIVYEKETKLLMIMKMMGLESPSYWLVTYAWFFAQFMFMFLLLYVLGVAAGMNTFGLHDGFVVWFFAFTWANLLIAFSFLVSIFFSSSRTSTASVFLMILIFNTVGVEIISVLVLDPYATESQYSGIMWLPPMTMIRVVIWLSLAGAFKEPIKTEQLMTYAGGAIGNTFIYMWVEWLVCMLLVWYLEKVWVAGFGVSYHPLFFLKRSYWVGKGTDYDALDLASIPIPEDAVASGFENRMGEDCKKEHQRVITPGGDALVRIVRLNKRFPNGKLAVKALSLGINRNECFSLLGHNGAGKTTTINMMCGLFEPSGGTATVDGFSIKSDMSRIQARTGVCVQENILWESLSCRDHVLFFGRLKGLRGAELSVAVDRALVAVNLKQFEHRAAGALSGGMKRRLSVANALIGDPKVVYLDEPSTGLDPASRRQLWDVISHAKGNKSIVLTTHSMEEAEILADRVGVMALGELQCVGTPSELCLRYGKGYTLILTVEKPNAEKYSEADAFVRSVFPTAKILEEPIGGTVKYEVSRSEVKISEVFARFENPETKKQLHLLNWGITETTLEEVFLHLAEMAHVSEELQKPPVEQGKYAANEQIIPATSALSVEVKP